jgi:hypothetical protein
MPASSSGTVSSGPLATSSPWFGAAVVLFGFGLLVQCATLAIVAYSVFGGGFKQVSQQPSTGQTPAPANGPASAESQPKAQNPIPAAPLVFRDAPAVLIPAELVGRRWMQCGDEVFSLDSTTLTNLANLPPRARFEVLGHGTCEPTVGEALFEGSRVRVSRVMPGAVSLVTDDGARTDVAVAGNLDNPEVALVGPREPSPNPATSIAAGVTVTAPADPRTAPPEPATANPDNGPSISPKIDEAIRRAMAEGAIRGTGTGPANDHAPTGPAGNEPKNITSRYPSNNWAEYTKSIREALLDENFGVQDSIAADYSPAGACLARFSPNIDLPLTGLEVGDVVTSVADVAVRTRAEFLKAVREASFGASMKFGIRRGGAPMVIEIVRY